jgi:hypothetical protein
MLYSSRRRERAFVRETARLFSLPRLPVDDQSGVTDFEYCDLIHRQLGVAYLAHLLDRWPKAFLMLARNTGLSRAYIVGDRSEVPFWLENSALDQLRAGTQEISNAEYEAIRRYLNSKANPPAPWYRNLVRLMNDASRKRRGTTFRAERIGYKKPLRHQESGRSNSLRSENG